MKRLHPLRLSSVLMAAAALLLAACGAGSGATPAFDFTPAPGGEPGGAPAETGDGVAALVNGQPVSVEAFQRELARFEAGQAALGFQVADQSGYRQQVLDLLIEQELIRQQAAAQGITVSDAEVDQFIAGMVAETGQEYFDSWLNSSYYTPEEFREAIRLDLMTNRLIAPILDGVPTRAEHVHARHILVNTQQQAEEVLARLTAGEDFAALAAEYSVDVTTRDIGGDLGWFPRGGLLVPEVEEIAFSMTPGQTSGVVPSAWGFHVVQTLEFEADREIESETRQRLMERTIEQWQQTLRDGADVQQMIDLTS